MTNQFAAMPSLHVGWALWCGVMLWKFGGSRITKIAAVAYPLTITFVVMGTANHYLLDAVAGVAVMGLGLWLSRPVLRLAERVRARFAPASSATGASIVGAGCETSVGERIPGQRKSSDTPAEADDSTPSKAR